MKGFRVCCTSHDLGSFSNRMLFFKVDQVKIIMNHFIALLSTFLLYNGCFLLFHCNGEGMLVIINKILPIFLKSLIIIFNIELSV